MTQMFINLYGQADTFKACRSSGDLNYIHLVSEVMYHFLEKPNFIETLKDCVAPSGT